MSYTPTNWKSGDVVTAAKLNKLEQGVAGSGGPMIIHGTPSGSTITLDKTYAEIFEGLSEKGCAFITVDLGVDTITNSLPVIYVQNLGSDYMVMALTGDGADPSNFNIIGMTFTTNSEDGYPVFSSGGQADSDYPDHDAH